MAKPDIKAEACLDWNEYLSKPIDQALPSIYTKACAMSVQFTTWYWSSIRGKRRMSLGIRALTFLLLVAGTLIPIVTGLYGKPEQQLLFTQLAFVSLHWLVYFKSQIKYLVGLADGFAILQLSQQWRIKAASLKLIGQVIF